MTERTLRKYRKLALEKKKHHTLYEPDPEIIKLCEIILALTSILLDEALLMEAKSEKLNNKFSGGA